MAASLTQQPIMASGRGGEGERGEDSISVLPALTMQAVVKER